MAIKKLGMLKDAVSFRMDSSQEQSESREEESFTPMQYVDLLDNPPYDRISDDLNTGGFALRVVLGDLEAPKKVFNQTRRGSARDTKGRVRERFATRGLLADKEDEDGRSHSTWDNVADKVFTPRSRVNLVVLAPYGDLSGSDVHANLIVLFPEQATIVWFEPNGIRFVDREVTVDKHGRSTGLSLDDLKQATVESLFRTKTSRTGGRYKSIHYVSGAESLNTDSLPKIQDALQGNCLAWCWAAGLAARKQIDNPEAYIDSLSQFISRAGCYGKFLMGVPCEAFSVITTWSSPQEAHQFFVEQDGGGGIRDLSRDYSIALANLGIQLIAGDSQVARLKEGFSYVAESIESEYNASGVLPKIQNENIIYLTNLFRGNS